MTNFTRILGVSTIALALASGAAYADAGKTPEQVRAELVAAQKAGEMPVGFVGESARELFPDQYRPAAATDPKPLSAAAAGGKTREQVRAELVAAQKAGEMPVGFVGLSQREVFPGLYPVAGSAHVAHTDSTTETR